MLDGVLKVGACDELINMINEKGYSVKQISKMSKLCYKEVYNFMNGDTSEVDFLMLSNLCNAIHVNVFDYVKDDIKLKDFLSLVY